MHLLPWWNVLTSKTEANEVAKKLQHVWSNTIYQKKKKARGRLRVTEIFGLSFFVWILQGKHLWACSINLSLAILKQKNTTLIVFTSFSVSVGLFPFLLLCRSPWSSNSRKCDSSPWITIVFSNGHARIQRYKSQTAVTLLFTSFNKKLSVLTFGTMFHVIFT